MKRKRWHRKTITLPGCDPFPALVDPKKDKFGRCYGFTDNMGAPFYPECISEPRPEFKQQYKALEASL